jgi:hypothetical protein
MALSDILAENRKHLIDRWSEAVLQTYPLDTVGFLRKQDDPFANPVGDRTRKAVTALVDILMGETMDTDDLEAALDDMMRMRSVQDFTPGAAVGVIFHVKTLVRELVRKRLKREPALAAELLQFESKVDSVALISFNIHSRCREEVYELRVREIKNQHARLLKRAKMLYEDPAEEPKTKQ